MPFDGSPHFGSDPGRDEAPWPGARCIVSAAVLVVAFWTVVVLAVFRAVGRL